MADKEISAMLPPRVAVQTFDASDRLAARLTSGKEAVRLLRATTDAIPRAVFFVDPVEMRFIHANREAHRSLGYGSDELLVMGPRDVVAASSWSSLAKELSELARAGTGSKILPTLQLRKDGSQFAVQWLLQVIPSDGGPMLIVVAEERGAQRPLDPLTALPDRRLFDRRLSLALERSRKNSDYGFAVLFIDLDGFKAVNDAYGHLAGDRLLCLVAKRIAGGLRPGDMVSRYGGDEFTVLVDDLRDEKDAIHVAERIHAKLNAPIQFDGHEVSITASIGIVVNSHEYDGVQSLLRDADRAMYRVKALGRAGHAIFNKQGVSFHQAREPGGRLMKPGRFCKASDVQ